MGWHSTDLDGGMANKIIFRSPEYRITSHMTAISIAHCPSEAHGWMDGGEVVADRQCKWLCLLWKVIIMAEVSRGSSTNGRGTGRVLVHKY